MDEQLPSGYFLQTTPEGGRWRLYDIHEQSECRICEINAAGDRLELQLLSSPYDAALEHWNAGVQEQLICTNRIIEILWKQQAPQAIADQLAAWHREEEAQEFAALQSPAPPTFTAADEERDFREWMDALNEQRDDEVGLSAEERLHGGLNDFYAQEAEMERQLSAEAEADAEDSWFEDWEVPIAQPGPEEMVYDPGESAHDEEWLEEPQPMTPGYREWDDMDNFWNQEGVFEEMSDLYPLDDGY